MKKKNIFILTLIVAISFSMIRTVNAQNLGITDATSLTPQSLLHIHQNAATGTLFQLTNTTSNNSAQTNGFIINLNTDFKTEFKNQYNNANAGISFFTNNGSTTEKVTILNSGNVGIGTTIPGAGLEIGTTTSATVPSIYLNSSEPNYIMCKSSDGSDPKFTNRGAGTKLVLKPTISGTKVDFAIGNTVSNFWFSIPDASTTNTFTFYGGITPLMYLDGGGNLGVGRGAAGASAGVHVCPTFTATDAAPLTYTGIKSSFALGCIPPAVMTSWTGVYVENPNVTLPNMITTRYGIVTEWGPASTIMRSGIGITDPTRLFQVNGELGLGSPLGATNPVSGSLIFYNSVNTNAVTILGGTTSTSYNITLPAAQGAADTYLKNDGAGNLTWAAGGGGGSTAWDDITAPDADLTLAHAANKTVFSFDGVTTQTAFTMSSSGISTGNLLSLTTDVLTTGAALNITTSTGATPLSDGGGIILGSFRAASTSSNNYQFFVGGGSSHGVIDIRRMDDGINSCRIRLMAYGAANYIESSESSSGNLFDNGSNLIVSGRAGSVVGTKAIPQLTFDATNAIITGTLNIGTSATTSSALCANASGAKTGNYSGTILNNIATSSTASITKAGLQITSTGTWNGASASNIGLYVSSVTGGTANYDAIFNGGGNVGIGTTAPATKLEVNGTARMTGFQLGTSATAGYVLMTNASGVGTWQAGVPGATGPTGSVGGTGTAGQVAYWSNAANITGNNNLYWDNTNGRLGIGTTSPNAGLSIYKNSASRNWLTIINSNGTSESSAIDLNGLTHSWEIGTDVNTNGGDDFYIYGNSAFRLAINSSGNVGIGTTSPSAGLDVAGTAEFNSTVTVIGLATASATALGLNASNQLVFKSSSKRYKKDIVDLDLNTTKDKFMKLRPVSFTWNEKSGNPGMHDIGLIAEEVEKIDTTLVFYNKDKQVQSVSYDAVNILTMKVVQEQQKEIERLKTENESLKARLSDNEIRLDRLESAMETADKER